MKEERTTLKLRRKKNEAEDIEQRTTLHIRKKKNKSLSVVDKNRGLSNDDMTTLKIVSFKKLYQKYLDEEGVAPDEFVDDVVNKIAYLYYYKRVITNRPDFIREKLKEIKYNKFLELVMETSTSKLEKLGIARKCKVGLEFLLQLFTFLKIENDEKIKIKYNLMDIKAVVLNLNNLYLFSDSMRYRIQYWFDRAYAIKNGKIIANGFDTLLDNDDLKGSVVMIEYENSKFLSIPYRVFKKLSSISTLELNYKIINDVSGDGITHNDDIIIETYDADSEYYNDNIVWYSYSLTAKNTFEIIRQVMIYEAMYSSLDIYANITEECLYAGDEEVIITLKDDFEPVSMKYEQFIKKYFPQLRF